MAAVARFFLLTLLAKSLTGCVAPLLGAGATTGVVATEERGLEAAAIDTRIQTEIAKKLADNSFHLYNAVSVDVMERRVLLTGSVKSPDDRAAAVKIAWQTDGVRDVYDEIVVTEEGGITDYARDSWISNQLRTALLLDSDIRSANYKVVTNNGVITLLGIAQNQEELNAVMAHARGIQYVRKVVSHVMMKDDPRRNQ